MMLAVLATSDAFAAIRVRGSVHNVRDNSRRFTLRAEGGRQYEVAYLGPKSGFGVKPPTLRDGDRVEVLGADVRGVFEAEQITLLSGGGGSGNPGTVTGRLEAVGTSSSVLHVQSQGRQWRVDARESSIYNNRGQRIALRDLREGQRVQVRGRDTGSNEIRAQRVDVMDGGGGGGGNPGSITGRLEAVGTSSQVLHVQSQGRQWRVDARESSIYNSRGQRIALRDLREGSRVQVQGQETGGSEIRARRVDVVGDGGSTDGWQNGERGRIDAVGTSSGILHVYFGGNKMRVNAKNATISLNGRQRELRDLRSGDQVRVYGRRQSSDTIDAERVEANR
jgi:hypothetical protein